MTKVASVGLYYWLEKYLQVKVIESLALARQKEFALVQILTTALAEEIDNAIGTAKQKSLQRGKMTRSL